jgi:hypothetical protein
VLNSLSLSPSLSLFSPSLSPHNTFCTLFSLHPSNTCFRSHIEISPTFFFLLHSLSSGTRNFLCHLSYFLLYLDSLILSLLSCLSVSSRFHSALHSSIFLLLFYFPLLHWHTRFSDSFSLSPSFFPVFFFFLFSIPVVSCTSSLPYILSSNFAALFPAFTISLFPNTLPSLCDLAFLCLLLAPLSNIFFSISSYFFYPHFSIMLSLKRYHSPPKITSPLSLSYSQTYPTTLFAFLKDITIASIYSY